MFDFYKIPIMLIFEPMRRCSNGLHVITCIDFYSLDFVKILERLIRLNLLSYSSVLTTSLTSRCMQLHVYYTCNCMQIHIFSPNLHLNSAKLKNFFNNGVIFWVGVA